MQTEIVRETIQARYTYTPLEAVEVSKKLTASMAELKRIDAEFDSIKAQFKSRKAVCEDAIAKFERFVDDGFEMRPTLAQVLFNTPEPGRKTYYHDRTGEMIREDEMTYEDNHRPLFTNENGGDATAPAQKDSEFVVYVPDQPKSFPDEDGKTVELETAPPAATNLGDALDAAAAKTDAPQFVLDIDQPDWIKLTLNAAWKKAAKKVGWTEAQVATLKDVLKGCETVEAMIDTLRPHVVVPAAQGPGSGAVVDAEGVECPACKSVSFDGTPCVCETGANPDDFGPDETTDDDERTDL